MRNQAPFQQFLLDIGWFHIYYEARLRAMRRSIFGFVLATGSVAVASAAAWVILRYFGNGEKWQNAMERQASMSQNPTDEGRQDLAVLSQRAEDGAQALGMPLADTRSSRSGSGSDTGALGSDQSQSGRSDGSASRSPQSIAPGSVESRDMVGSSSRGFSVHERASLSRPDSAVSGRRSRQSGADGLATPSGQIGVMLGAVGGADFTLTRIERRAGALGSDQSQSGRSDGSASRSPQSIAPGSVESRDMVGSSSRGFSVHERASLSRPDSAVSGRRSHQSGADGLATPSGRIGVMLGAVGGADFTLTRIERSLSLSQLSSGPRSGLRSVGVARRAGAFIPLPRRRAPLQQSEQTRELLTEDGGVRARGTDSTDHGEGLSGESFAGLRQPVSSVGYSRTLIPKPPRIVGSEVAGLILARSAAHQDGAIKEIFISRPLSQKGRQWFNIGFMATSLCASYASLYFFGQYAAGFNPIGQLSWKNPIYRLISVLHDSYMMPLYSLLYISGIPRVFDGVFAKAKDYTNSAFSFDPRYDRSTVLKQYLWGTVSVLALMTSLALAFNLSALSVGVKIGLSVLECDTTCMVGTTFSALLSQLTLNLVAKIAKDQARTLREEASSILAERLLENCGVRLYEMGEGTGRISPITRRNTTTAIIKGVVDAVERRWSEGQDTGDGRFEQMQQF